MHQIIRPERPRYFFDVHDPDELIDEAGSQHADLPSARRHALIVATDFVRGPASSDTEGSAVIVVVRDASGARVATARLAYSVESMETAPA